MDIKKENSDQFSLHKDEFVHIFEEKIKNKDYNGIKEILENLHPADIAEIISDLEPNDSLRVFKLISSLKNAGDVLSHLGVLAEGVERDILDHLTDEKIAAIISEMESDEAADILNLFSQERVLKILKLLNPEIRSELKELLEYKSDTAGGLMDFEYLAINQEKTVKEAIDIIRTEILPRSSRMYSYTNIYVVDDLGKLVGYLPMKDLLIMPQSKKIKDVMYKNVIKVNPEVDQEEVAKLFIKYDLVSLPVVDKENRIIGRITVDDVIDVIQEEATEDMLKMAGAEEDDLWQHSVFKVASLRIPWLLTTLFGGLCNAMILKTFSMTISEVVALTFFVPVITGMGGNIGIQTSTIVVRGLATGYIEMSELGWVLFREIKVASIMGLTCGTVVGIVAEILGNSPIIGLVVGVSMFFAIIVAALMGCFIPVFFKKINVDPAISSGPFVTTANDMTGLIIYLGLSTALISYIKG